MSDFNVHSVSDETSFTNTRLPEMAGWAQVALSAARASRQAEPCVADHHGVADVHRDVFGFPTCFSRPHNESGVLMTLAPSRDVADAASPRSI